MLTVVVAAASFDDMVAITGYTIFINIAIQARPPRSSPLPATCAPLTPRSAHLLLDPSLGLMLAYRRRGVAGVVLVSRLPRATLLLCADVMRERGRADAGDGK